MLQPPSIPRARMIRSADARSIWCSRSESVCAGATTTESPVWTPNGSRFSMLQTVMQVSTASRITSYSSSFQPQSERSTSTCPIGEADTRSAQRIGGPHHQRQTDLAAELQGGLNRLADPRGRHRLSDLQKQLLERLAVLRHPDRLSRCAEQLDAELGQDAPVMQI